MKQYALHYGSSGVASAPNAPIQPISGKRPENTVEVAPLGTYSFGVPSKHGSDFSGNGKNLSLIGSNSYITAGEYGVGWGQGGTTSTRYALADAVYDITAFTAWVYMNVDATAGINDIMGVLTTTGNFNWALSLENAVFRYFHNHGVTAVTRTVPEAPFEDGELAWIGVNRNGSGDLRFFLNGILVDTATSTPPTSYSTPELWIGTPDTAAGHTGRYHAARVFSGVLTDAQMQREYEAVAGVSLG